MISSPSQAGFFKKKVEIGTEDRPATLILPKNYNKKKPVPLVVGLHGLGTSISQFELLFGLARNQNKLGYALITPEALPRPADDLVAWNATEECCRYGDDLDDSGYIQGLVRKAIAEHSIDTDQVFLFGHSNGSFMNHRLACDTNGLFKGIVGIAGSTFASPELCLTGTPINVLHIHGTEDSIVPYTGENKDYPGAEETVARWAERNQCQDFQETLLSENLLFFGFEPGYDDDDNLILIGSLKDISLKPESDALVYSQCKDETVTGLWRVNGANHIPLFIGRNVVAKSLRFVGYK